MVRKAAIGAATIPPMIIGMIILKSMFSRVKRKVIEIASVTKNSAKLTEPIVFLGCEFAAIKVGDVIGPHPPPPIASTNPAVNPKGSKPLILGRIYSSLFFLKNFRIITNPKMRSIPDIIGLISAIFCNLTAE